MKKLIIKTVTITIALMVAVGGLFYLTLAGLKPSVLGDFYFRLNNQSLTIKYSEKAYEKSQSIEDLSLLTERAIVFGQDALIQKHAVVLINDKDYKTFTKSKNANYHYFIVSSLCLSLYDSNKKGEAISTALNHTYEYSQSNPVRYLIAKCVEVGDKTTLLGILDGLNSRSDKNQFVNQDIISINEFLNN